MAGGQALRLWSTLTLHNTIKLTHVSRAEAKPTVVLVMRGRRNGRLAIHVGRDAGRDLLPLELSESQFWTGIVATDLVSNHFMSWMSAWGEWQLMNAVLLSATGSHFP